MCVPSLSGRGLLDIRDCALTLRKRWRLIAVCLLLAVLAALAATPAAAPTYQASAQLFVSTATGADGNVAGLQQGGQFAQQRVKSYADIVDSPPVTEASSVSWGWRSRHDDSPSRSRRPPRWTPS